MAPRVASTPRFTQQRRSLRYGGALAFLAAVVLVYASPAAATVAADHLSPFNPALAQRIAQASQSTAKIISDQVVARRDIPSDIEKLVAEAIEKVLKDIVEGLNITAIDLAIKDMHLPPITVDMTSPLINVTLDVASKNYTEIDVSLHAPTELFDVVLTSGDMDMAVNLTSESLPMNVTLNADQMPMQVEIDSDKLPMTIAMKSDELPMSILINGDQMPMNVALQTESMPMTVQMESLDIGFVSWIMLSVLLVLQLALAFFLFRHQRRVSSLEAVTKTLQTGSTHSYCTECGTRNGFSAKFCFSCGTKMVRNILSTPSQVTTVYGSVQYQQIEDSK
ncbi:hypothetical protein CAOG_00681 [Capsaspora owczarzaki ATCC 30864]|uniref:Zinc-ribbon domain-containing protein n=1 Tax=Capsaspora owczarzaki (strain ATCC 30864) TaxID=595528 RepID=A0A0D2VGY2_CAPO3|nr:hypothetical protein CAOG_00681 [Capsaspora owczarzaki ATCC 30864]KJE89152.1 hypothetical protein, variant [Capsaspora owczarzaki ATCC 30864]|eukprot:XP_004365552.1 hypothetical protein CAOG_00681 [Capsaspora owczarzaki ATCC 30864]